VNITLQAHLFS